VRPFAALFVPYSTNGLWFVVVKKNSLRFAIQTMIFWDTGVPDQ